MWGQWTHDFSKNGFVTPRMRPALGGSLLTSCAESLSCIVKYGRISPASGIYRKKGFDSHIKDGYEQRLTGRMRSRNHQIAWLVWAGDIPKTRMGSQRTKHSQIDQRFGSADSNKSKGGGMNGAVVARIWIKMSKNKTRTELSVHGP